MIKPQKATAQHRVSTIKEKAEAGEEDQRSEGPRAPSPGNGPRLRSEGWEREKRISQAEGEVRAPPTEGTARRGPGKYLTSWSVCAYEEKGKEKDVVQDSSCNTQAAVKICSGLVSVQMIKVIKIRGEICPGNMIRFTTFI